MMTAFEILLRLYPKQYRIAFGREMAAVFAESFQDRRKLGWGSVSVFLSAELLGVVREAIAIRLAPEQGRSIDLTRMRPPEVSRESYSDAIDEVLAAQRSVDFNLRRMQEAIAVHAFVEARFYSDEDRRARERLRIVRAKYGIAE